MECLDDRTVLAFLAGRGAGDAEAIDAHLAVCPACCDLVVHAARRSFATGTPALDETSRATPSARRPDAEPPLGERYTIEAVLGAGGQALVYTAHDTVLGRRVALKLLRDTRDAGVLDEARVAAQLNHPNIVAVHDAGRLPDGQLYLAMEHVAGGSLDRWLARERRDRAEVLRVLVDAGRGLAAAHDAGIVHRDIKAANILVGEDGRARVTDFGLATLGERAVIAGTLPYMAPEQLAGEATAASDQFGFAATAWEALTGALPFAPIADRAAAIAAGIVTPRTPLPRRLDRALRRALSVEPAGRWPSMHALVGALAADPARRWMWIGIGAMALMTAGATGGAIAARDTGGPSCADVPSAALAPARRAEIEARFAASKAPFAAGLRPRVMAALDAYTAALDGQRADACHATRVGTQSSELLDLREQCLDERTRALDAFTQVLAHADDAELENAMTIVGGLPPLAPCADRGWLVERVRPPADAAGRARVERVVSHIATSTAQLRAGSIPAAIATAEAAVAAARELDHLPTRARAELAAGQAQAKLGETARAEQHLQAAAQLAQRGHDDLTAAEAWIELVKVIGHGNARYDEALRYAGFADATAARLGSSTGLRARLAYYKCAIFDLQAKLEDAERACDEASTLWTGELGPNAPEIADVLVIAARVAYKRARPDVAGATIARALAIREAVLGADHPAIMEALFVTAQLALGSGRFAAARAAIDRALRIGRAAFGEDAMPLAAVYAQRAALRHRTRDLAGALEDIDRSMAVRERVDGVDHPDLVFNLVTRARILEDLKRDPEAAVAYERARVIAERALGDKHPSLSAILQDLGRLHGRLGDAALAQRELDRAIAVAKAGEQRTALAGATSALAEFLHAGGKPAAAIPHYRDALAAYEALLGPEHPQLVATLQNLGSAYIETKQPREALSVLTRGLAIETAASGDHAGALFGLLEPLGDAQLALGDRAAARASWTRAVGLEGGDPAQVAEVQAKLRRLR